MRPKRVARSGEQPTAALRRDGIEYVEVRSLDVSPLDPAGINQNTMRFIEAFLVYCVLEKSPELDENDLLEVRANHTETASLGRDPDFRLMRNGESVALNSWASEILDKVLAVAEVIDAGDASASYAESVRQMQQKVAHPDMLPSARLLDELRQTGSSFFEYSLDMAKKHSEYFASITPLDEHRAAEFEQEARDSIRRQLAIEASDNISLDEYLRRYLSNC